jgi:hypothetical protein
MRVTRRKALLDKHSGTSHITTVSYFASWHCARPSLFANHYVLVTGRLALRPSAKGATRWVPAGSIRGDAKTGGIRRVNVRGTWDLPDLNTGFAGFHELDSVSVLGVHRPGTGILAYFLIRAYLRREDRRA